MFIVAKKLNSFGDTIVEVMIVLAVLGLSIGIAYATANRSLLNARQAQESAEASSLAQTQVEYLRAWADNKSDNPDQYIYQPDSKAFCISGEKVNFINAATDCTALNGSRYDVRIEHESTTDKFTVVVTWDDVLGQGPDTATLIYRVHPTQ